MPSFCMCCIVTLDTILKFNKCIESGQNKKLSIREIDVLRSDSNVIEQNGI